MMSSFLRFFLGLLVITAVLIPADYFLIDAILGVEFNRIYYFSFAFFVVLLVIFQLALYNALKKRPQRFVASFMGAIGIKMLASLLLMVFLMFVIGEEKKTFGVNFISLYLIYTTWSVYHILKVQRKIGKESKDEEKG